MEEKLSAERAKVDDLAGKINRMPDWETFNKMRDLLQGILDNTRMTHLDMGGKHKYVLTHKACPIVSEAIVFMNEKYYAAEARWNTRSVL